MLNCFFGKTTLNSVDDLFKNHNLKNFVLILWLIQDLFEK